MGLLLKITNDDTALNIGGIQLLAADSVGYWGLTAGNNVETDSDGVITAVTLSGRSDHTNDLVAAFRFVPGTDVIRVQVGQLTTNGVFSSFLSS